VGAPQQKDELRSLQIAAEIERAAMVSSGQERVEPMPVNMRVAVAALFGMSILFLVFALR
jgi:hypothetical protein